MKNIVDMTGDSATLGNRYNYQPENEVKFESHIKNEARLHILDLLSKSDMGSKPCLCGEANTDEFDLLSLVDKQYLPARNIICKSCGTIRIDPLPNNYFYTEVYSTLYWKLLHGNSELTKNRFNLSVKRANPYWNYLKSRCNVSLKKIVEIGASYGA